MKVLHIALLSYFAEGMHYQDNYLLDINAHADHDVIFVTNVYTYSEGEIIEVPEADYALENGARIIRLKYDFIGNSFLTNKIQKVRKLKLILDEFSPDSIMYHGVCGYELMDVADYVKNHPNTLFYVDSHEDFYNTARTWLSYVAYKYIHGYFVRKALPYVNKVLYLSEDSKVYLKKMYNIKDELLEFYPLGGIITSREAQEDSRNKLIEELDLPYEATIYMHSGKMDAGKKTRELIEAFKKVRSETMYLIIFGSIPEETKAELEDLIRSDKNIIYLGWKSGKEIIYLLNAADVYCQPGTQSATSQTALCCGCAEIVAPAISYRKMYEDNVLFADNTLQIANQISLLSDKEKLQEYKNRGYKCACEILDYAKLAERYLRK